MKLSRLKVTAGLLFLLGVGSVQADPIDGSIGFAGTFSTDNNSDFTLATQFTSITGITLSATGDFAGVAIFTPVIFTPFTFTASGVTPLWAINGGQYSFNATNVNVQTTSNSIIASGSGVAHVTGFDTTPGYWNLAGSGTGLSLTFAASTNVSASVPDGGRTLVLLGMSVLGAAAFQFSPRRLRV